MRSVSAAVKTIAATRALFCADLYHIICYAINSVSYRVLWFSITWRGVEGGPTLLYPAICCCVSYALPCEGDHRSDGQVVKLQRQKLVNPLTNMFVSFLDSCFMTLYRAAPERTDYILWILCYAGRNSSMFFFLVV